MPLPQPVVDDLLTLLGRLGDEATIRDPAGLLAGPPASAPPPGAPPHRSIVLATPEPVAGDELQEIADSLGEDGRILLVVTAPHADAAVVAASRAGFAIRRRAVQGHGPETLHGFLLQPTAYIVRALEEDDIDDVLELFEPSFHARRSRDHWHWKFDHNPLGQRRVSLARHRDGELAAHYAGYPVPFRDTATGRRMEAMQIGDTMTAPAHRAVGRGPTSLLARTVAHYYARWCRSGVAFNYGVNTGNIQRFSFRFVRAHPVEDVVVWQRDAGVPLAPWRRYRVREETRPGRRFDRLFERAAPAYGALVERNAAWLRWRYLDCPDTPGFELLTAHRWGRLAGWAVFRRVGDELRWVDALVDPRQTRCVAALLRRALRRHPDATRIRAWFPLRPTWWAEVLESLDFVRTQEPDGLGFVCVPHGADDAVEVCRRMYYSWGDSDLA